MILTFALLQTRVAKNMLASLVSRNVSGPGYERVDVGRIDGFVPFDMRLAHVNVADETKTWLRVESATLKWSPWPLFRGQLHVQTVSAERVILAGIPAMDPAERKPFRIPELPRLPAWLEIDTASISELELTEDVVPEAGLFRAAGRYHPSTKKNAVDIGIEIRRLDAPTTHADASVRLAGNELTVNVDAKDSTYIPAYLNVDEPITLRINGSGPLSDWVATATATLGDRESLRADAQFAADKVSKLTLTGSATLIEPLVPAGIVQRIGRTVQWGATVKRSEDGRMDMTGLTFRSPLIDGRGSGRWHPEAETLSASVQVKHRSLAALAPLLEEDDAPLAVSASLEGSNSEYEWTVNGRLGHQQVADMSGTASINEVYQAKFDGTVVPPGFLVPPRAHNLVAGPITVHMMASYAASDGHLTVSEGTFETDWAMLTVDGELNLDTEVFGANADLRVADFTRFEDILGDSIEGIAAIVVNASGTSEHTKAKIQLDATAMQARKVTVEHANLVIEANAGPWLNDPVSAFSARLSGTVGPGRFEHHTQPVIDVSAALRRLDTGAYALTDVRLADGTTTITGQGAYLMDAPESPFQIRLDTTDAAQYLRILDQPYGGAATISIDGVVVPDETAVHGTMNAVASDLRDLPVTLEPLLSAPVELTTAFSATGERADVESLEMNTESLRVTGDGSYAYSDGRFDARLQAQSDSLEVLDVLLGQSVRGRARLRADGSGTLDRFSATAVLAATNFETGYVQVDTLNSTLEARGAMDALQFQLYADATHADRRLEAHSTGSYSDSDVAVESLRLTAGPNSIEGRGRWNFDTRTGFAATNIVMNDVSMFDGFLDTNLAGSIQGQGELNAGSSTATATASLDLDSFESEYGSIEQAQVRAELSNVFEDPAGTVDVAGSGIVYERVSLRELRLAADATDSRFRVDVRGDGTLAEDIPFDLETNGFVASTLDSVEILGLRGHLDEYAIAFEQPALIEFSDASIRLSDTALAFGEGRIRAAAAWSKEHLAVEASWNALPLTIANLAGLPLKSGTAEGAVSIQGPPSAPTGEATMFVREAKTQAMADAGDWYADADVSIVLSPDRTDLTLGIRVPDAGWVNASATLPLESGNGLPRIQEKGPATGNLEADVDISVIPPIFDLPAHVTEGLLKASAEVTGTPASPEIQGRAGLENGRYENGETGTILQDLTIELLADTHTIELTKFDATDGAGGNVRLRGRLALDETQQFPFEATAEFDDVRLVHRDDVSARVRGGMNLTGTAQRADVSGNLELGSTTIILRPSKAASIPELEVVEVNLPVEHTAVSEQTETALPAVRLDIRINVPGRTFVRATGLETEWEGQMFVGGTLQDPEISGEVKPVRGYIAFLGRRFQIEQESSIVVDTKNTTQPYLNLIATTSRADISAVLTIRGTLDQLDMEITSEPPLPREEVLARVLFGRQMSEVTPVQALQLARAVAIFSGRFEGIPFFSGPSRLVFVDTLDIRSGETGPVVGAGKYLSDDVFIEVEQGAGIETSRVRVEYQFTPQIGVESSLGLNARVGLGLFWKYAY